MPNHNLTKCAVCSTSMTTDAFKSHVTIHERRAFKCNESCIEEYFGTIDDLEEHKKFRHEEEVVEKAAPFKIVKSEANENDQLKEIYRTMWNRGKSSRKRKLEPGDELSEMSQRLRAPSTSSATLPTVVSTCTECGKNDAVDDTVCDLCRDRRSFNSIDTRLPSIPDQHGDLTLPTLSTTSDDSLDSAVNRKSKAFECLWRKGGKCVKSFAEPSSLLEHIRLSHGIELYTKFCEYDIAEVIKTTIDDDTTLLPTVAGLDLSSMTMRNENTNMNASTLTLSTTIDEQMDSTSDSIMSPYNLSDRRFACRKGCFEKYFISDTRRLTHYIKFHNCNPSEDKACSVFCQWGECTQYFVSQRAFFTHVNDEHMKLANDHICWWKDCERRGASTTTMYNLVAHGRTHTGEKPYRCTEPDCDKVFSRFQYLKHHVRMHKNERPFKCSAPDCTKSFTNASDRNKHTKRTHSNDKYKCLWRVDGKCEKAYTDPSTLRKHIKRKHGTKLYASLYGDKTVKTNDDTEPASPSTSSQLPAVITKCTDCGNSVVDGAVCEHCLTAQLSKIADMNETLPNDDVNETLMSTESASNDDIQDESMDSNPNMADTTSTDHNLHTDLNETSMSKGSAGVGDSPDLTTNDGQTCDVCRAHIKHSDMVRHMRLHDPIGRPFACHKGCVRTYFRDYSARVAHYSEHHAIAAVDNTAAVAVDVPAVSSGSVKRENESFPLRCTVCGNRSQYIFNRIRHMKMHSQVGQPFACLKGCVKTYFATNKARSIHYGKRHDGAANTMNVDRHEGQDGATSTTVMYNRGSAVSAHVKYSAATFTCTVCGQRASLSNKARHMRTHNPVNRSFTCLKGCQRSYFVSISALGTHYTKCHSGETIVEPNRESADTTRLIKMEPTATTLDLETKMSGVPMLRCRVCDDRIMTHNMPKHMTFHDPVGRPFKCQQGCTRKFFCTLHGLKLHYGKRHKAIGNKHVRSVTNSATAHKPSVSSAKRTPLSTQRRPPWLCHICETRIVDGHRARHMQLHDPTGRPMQCDLGCKRMFFTDRCHLHQHYSIKHGRAGRRVKTVQTDEKTQLLAIRRTALGLRVDERTGGDSVTEQEPSSETHNETPIPKYVYEMKTCSVCGRSIPSNNSNQHMKMHSSQGRPFECYFGCNKTFFPSANALERHRIRMHKEESMENIRVVVESVATPPMDEEEHNRADVNDGPILTRLPAEQTTALLVDNDIPTSSSAPMAVKTERVIAEEPARSTLTESVTAVDQPTATSGEPTQPSAQEVVRRETIVAMLNKLPPTATDEQREKIKSLYDYL